MVYEEVTTIITTERDYCLNSNIQLVRINLLLPSTHALTDLSLYNSSANTFSFIMYILPIMFG